jgi:hypothetical protein
VNLTEDQILLLAPDEPSKKAGKDLANPSKWVTRGATTEAVWGECQGSGSKPYQTGIDLSNLAFKCSCPSRKFPCKHGIALGLLFARNSGSFTDSEAPAWVAEWMQKRAQKKVEAEVKIKDKPVDEAAQAKRQASREQKVSDGIDELLRWIKDLVRNGMLNVPEKGYAFWEAVSRRMVDAQAPGLAGLVKNLGETNFYKEGWQSAFLDNLLNLYLLARGYQNRENLSPLLQQDLRTWIGFTVSQEELKEKPGMLDTWLVVGKQVSEEDTLTVERIWLYGTNTKQFALVLQFIIRGQGGTLLLSPGMTIEAELVFYPSVTPLRALVKRQITSTVTPVMQVDSSWLDVAEKETGLCSLFPVRSERPYAVASVTPVQYSGRWWLKDSQSNLVSLKENFAGIWKLLALSGGTPIDMVVLGKENAYEPLGVWVHQTYKPL